MYLHPPLPSMVTTVTATASSPRKRRRWGAGPHIHLCPTMGAPAKACGRTYNIACGKSISLNELVGHINELTETGLEPVYAKERPGDIRHSLADISLARKWLGYEPQRWGSGTVSRER